MCCSKKTTMTLLLIVLEKSRLHFLAQGLYHQRHRAGISFEPIRLKAAWGSVAAFSLCVSFLGKSTYAHVVPFMSAYLCDCVSIKGFFQGVCLCAWMHASLGIGENPLYIAFDAQVFSCLLWNSKWGRWGNGTVALLCLKPEETTTS